MEPGPACYRLDSYDLTNEERQDILNAHNKFRAIVASGKESRGQGGPQPAGIIPPLVSIALKLRFYYQFKIDFYLQQEWDNELAEVAQRWAIQCDFNHDKCRNVGN